MAPTLYEHELRHLLEALRRDLRTQTLNAQRQGEAGEWHQQNARAILRLLELFNPRGTHRSRYRKEEMAA